MKKAMSMTREKIIEAAQIYFSKYGYEGTSLSLIAKEVGIRKASLYSHFPSKADLFLEVLNLTHEKTFLRIKELSLDVSLDSKEKLKEIFHLFCTGESVKYFCMSLVPPVELESETAEIFCKYDQEFNQYYLSLLQEYMSKNPSNKVTPHEASILFSITINGTLSKYRFSNEDEYKETVELCWDFFLRNITSQ